jgi:hypothetical protein
VTTSRTAGKIKARKELANAPINEISRSRCGTRADNPPEEKQQQKATKLLI